MIIRNCPKCKKETLVKRILAYDYYPLDNLKVRIQASKYKCSECGTNFEDDKLKEFNRVKAIEKKPKSEYAELTDYAFGKLGEINWKIFGNLHRKYTNTFIKQCIDKFPEYKKTLTPDAKAAYLAGICKNSSTSEDVKNPKIKLNIDGLRI